MEEEPARSANGARFIKNNIWGASVLIYLFILSPFINK